MPANKSKLSAQNTKVIIFVLIAFLIGVLVGCFVCGFKYQNNNISSYEQCAAAGYPILETYPEQCKTPDGRSFTRDINKLVPPNQVACTLDAKLCSDGSAVGRVPPTCEFVPCP